MFEIEKKKTKLAATSAAVVLVGGGAAFAYWTAGGSGTGSATTGTVTALTAVQTSAVSGMRPGDANQTLSGNFNNPNSGPVYVSTVTASIASVTQAVGAVGSCDATDYSLTDAVMQVNDQVPAGDGQGSWFGAKIKFNNKPAVNQDGCKGATVSLSYTIA